MYNTLCFNFLHNNPLFTPCFSIAYRIEYRKYQDEANVFSHEVAATENKYPITGLLPGAKYEARVICVTSAGVPQVLSRTAFKWISATVLGEWRRQKWRQKCRQKYVKKNDAKTNDAS